MNQILFLVIVIGLLIVGGCTLNNQQPEEVQGDLSVKSTIANQQKEKTNTLDPTVINQNISREEIFQIANETLIQKLGENLVNITIRKITPLNNKWIVDITTDYTFGCCRLCSPGELCVAVCAPCGIKTAEGNYVINSEGVIEEENIEETGCNANDGVWFRDIVGDDLCSVDWNNLS